VPFWRTFYHIVFATHERRPMLTVPLRQASTGWLQRKAEDLGCVVHAAGAQPGLFAGIVARLREGGRAATAVCGPKTGLRS
jgi:hypothetical protein